jgi:hypothetical protein
VDEEREPEEITVAVVGPDPRLLLVLVVVLVGAAIASVLVLGGEDDTGRVSLGSLQDLAQQAEAGPVRLSELPHLVIVRTGTPAPVYHASWSEISGSVLLTPHDQLVVLDTRDPEDGAELAWCRAARAFAHPQELRWYGPDGALLAGASRRGLDRRALMVVGQAVVVDDGSWVRGPEADPDSSGWSPRGDCGAD